MFTDLRPCPPGCAPGGIPPGGRLHLVYLMPRVELTGRSPWAEPSVLSSPLAVTTRAVDQTDQQILNVKNLKVGLETRVKCFFLVFSQRLTRVDPGQGVNKTSLSVE